MATDHDHADHDDHDHPANPPRGGKRLARAPCCTDDHLGGNSGDRAPPTPTRFMDTYFDEKVGHGILPVARQQH